MLAAILVLAAFSQATAAPPLWLEPADKWTVDYAENMCTLSRAYGTKEKSFILGLKPSPMSDSLQLVLISPGQGRPAYVKTMVAVNGATPIESSALAFTAPKAPLRVVLIDLKRSDLEPLAKSGKLSITVGKAAAVNLSVIRFDLALKGLEACEKDLLKHWGMSEEVQASIAAKPLPLKNLASYVDADDYPRAAILSSEQGLSGIRFMVGLDGTPRDCHVVEKSGSELLDQTTCRVVLTRSRFSPALDRAGKPVESLYFTRIRWVLPSG